MKKFLFALLPLALLLSACAGVQGDVPSDADAQAAASVVQAYIHTNEIYDADGLVALYHEDAFYLDHGMSIGPIDLGNLDYFIHETMAARDFKIKFHSYSITPGGRFAALTATYSERSGLTGKMTGVECVIILEMKDGLILSETWYYNNDTLH